MDTLSLAELIALRTKLISQRETVKTQHAAILEEKLSSIDAELEALEDPIEQNELLACVKANPAGVAVLLDTILIPPQLEIIPGEMGRGHVEQSATTSMLGHGTTRSHLENDAFEWREDICLTDVPHVDQKGIAIDFVKSQLQEKRHFWDVEDEESSDESIQSEDGGQDGKSFFPDKKEACVDCAF